MSTGCTFSGDKKFDENSLGLQAYKADMPNNAPAPDIDQLLYLLNMFLHMISKAPIAFKLNGFSKFKLK